jgi:hypothetical protein
MNVRSARTSTTALALAVAAAAGCAGCGSDSTGTSQENASAGAGNAPSGGSAAGGLGAGGTASGGSAGASEGGSGNSAGSGGAAGGSGGAAGGSGGAAGGSGGAAGGSGGSAGASGAQGGTGNGGSSGSSAICHGDEDYACDHNSFVDPNQVGADPTASVTRLVVLGDSLSRGKVAGAGKGYHDHVFRQLEDRYGNGTIELIEAARGQTVTGTLVELLLDGTPGTTNPLEDSIAGGFPADGHTIVVMTVGGDDVNFSQEEGASNAELKGRLLDDARKKLSEIVAWLRGTIPGRSELRFPDGVSIYIMNVYDPTDGLYMAPSSSPCRNNYTEYMPELEGVILAWHDGYVDEAMKLSAQGVGFSVIDALGHFRGHGHNFDNAAGPFYRAADPSGWFPTNCTHVANEGHKQLASLFWEALDRGHGNHEATP